jgi:hypothetical protein
MNISSIVGSNNSLLPWTGLGKTAPTSQQLAEVDARTKADLDLIDATFDKAIRGDQKAVVLLMQADMFDPTVEKPNFSDFYGFQPIVQKSLSGRRNSASRSTCSMATVTSSTRIARWQLARSGLTSTVCATRCPIWPASQSTVPPG